MTNDELGEASATDIVEARWQELLRSSRPDQQLTRAAYAVPQLRRLFPWTGMWELHFSRCTGQRWTWDIPYIAPAKDGQWAVCGPSRSEFVGWASTLDEALAMVVDRLPPNCGPAFVGTPAELAEHEKRQEKGIPEGDGQE